jgi:hypothetical protein
LFSTLVTKAHSKSRFGFELDGFGGSLMGFVGDNPGSACHMEGPMPTASTDLAEPALSASSSSGGLGNAMWWWMAAVFLVLLAAFVTSLVLFRRRMAAAEPLSNMEQ